MKRCETKKKNFIVRDPGHSPPLLSKFWLKKRYFIQSVTASVILLFKGSLLRPPAAYVFNPGNKTSGLYHKHILTIVSDDRK